MASDFVIALNATIYHAVIHSDYPLNTPVFRIRAIVSSIEALLDLTITLSQSSVINLIFEFENKTRDDTITITDKLVDIGDVYVFDATINLVFDPSTVFTESDYPVNLNMPISLVALYSPNTALQTVSMGTGQILNAPGKCAITFV